MVQLHINDKAAAGRTRLAVALLCTAVGVLPAGFAAGWWWRDRQLVVTESMPEARLAALDADGSGRQVPAASHWQTQERRTAAGPGRVAALVEAGEFSDAVLAIAAAYRGDEAAARAALHTQLDTFVAQRNYAAAAAWSEAILALFARDPVVLLAWANSLQQLGRARDAVAPLYEVIRSGTPAQAGEAQRQLGVLVDALLASLAQRGETGDLLALLDELLRLDPDNHRWRLLAARWQLSAGAEDLARAHLNELGPGVALTDAIRAGVNELRLGLDSERAGLPLTQRGSHWVASVSVGSVAAELMVDTGASMTVLTPQLLRAAGARALGRSVRVNTAGGTIAASLYEVASLRAGEHIFAPLTVASLGANLPADGLLGMDVLAQVGLDLAAEPADLR